MMNRSGLSRPAGGRGCAGDASRRALEPPPPVPARRRPAPFGGALPFRRRRVAALAAAAQNAAVGIDLGTTNSVVAVLRRGDAAPRVLRVDGGGAWAEGSCEGGGGFTIPSVASVDSNGAWLVGAPALARAEADPLNTFYSAKRLIGRRHADVAWSRLVYRLAEAPDGGAAIECPRLGAALAPEQVSAEVLRHAVGLASRYLGDDVTEAVVTVPAYFTPAQRAATLEAARLAGLQRASLLQEPVAAALAFGFGKPREAETILVFDLGGGTYDISVLESFEGIMEVLATSGDSQLGGDDFDRALVSLLLRRVSDSQARGGPAAAAALASDPRAAAALLRAAGVAKIELSSREEAAVRVPAALAAAAAGSGNSGGGGAGGGGASAAATAAGAEVVMTRADLLSETAALRARLWPPLEEVARECKLEFAAAGPAFERRLAATLAGSSSNSGGGDGSSSGSSSSGGSGRSAEGSGDAAASAAAAAAAAAADKYAPKPRRVTAAVLVGGATRMPVIRDYVRHVTGLEPRSDVDPEQCVAAGAAIHAALLLGLTSGVEVMDGSYVEELHERASGFQV